MNCYIRHYVEFAYPGALLPDLLVKELKEGEKQNIQLPNGAYGYRFFDEKEIPSTANKGLVLKGGRFNISPWYYKGEKYSLDEIKEKFPDKKILISNMTYNNWNNVVKTRGGQFIPLDEGDVVFD